MQRGHHLLFLTFFAFLSAIYQFADWEAEVSLPPALGRRGKDEGGDGQGELWAARSPGTQRLHAARKRLSEFSLEKKNNKKTLSCKAAGACVTRRP